MESLGNNCYCYNDECNQKKWEELGYEGKSKYIVVSDLYLSKKLDPKSKVPKCPYCKKKMTVTANLEYEY